MAVETEKKKKKKQNKMVNKMLEILDCVFFVGMSSDVPEFKGFLFFFFFFLRFCVYASDFESE